MLVHADSLFAVVTVDPTSFAIGLAFGSVLATLFWLVVKLIVSLYR